MPMTDGESRLLDEFAGAAMSSMVDRIVFDQPTEDSLHKMGVETDDFESYTAPIAYGFALAMVNERRRVTTSVDEIGGGDGAR